MPIGKNSIKRVTNNGYSKVKAEAPDMENSTVVTEKPAEPQKQEAPKAKKSSPKKASSPKAEPKAKAEKPKTEPKTTKAKAPKKSMESEPDLAPVKTLEKITSTQNEEEKDDSYVNIGGKMPYYLL